ncbi:hypothetical protein ES288_D05G179400v1 [Gossypium darwinii]|uniref:TOD1/MUCI70 glycosyltransferase-like domain-containing protein n=1 Tax=Gossypium darwinii TaxID=34276 RepID=A0A5D2CHD0_GOSDA|nr:hypothetical protein ES288_D05G179400v1 [Gossypium darwinii]
MSGGSLGIRSGSYGSLDKQLQNGVLPIQVPSATKTKPFKTFKEKETFLHWICKFAGRKKVGLLLLCAISAAIFVWVLYLGKGAFDNMLQPKNISKYSEQTVCLYMFVDEETKSDLETEHGLNESKKIGLWRIVVAHNLPYANGRRNGKAVSDARFSLWIDGKLQLLVDPYQILERFLWRKTATFAISRHYIRFDVFEEAEANKAARKYDNASIDFQVDFYKKEGLTPYSEAKLPIASDVPEGCAIIREHVPISNLFTCLWFNEIDRFTSRDQLSFSTVRDSVAAKTNWTVNMFLDCERRNFVVQAFMFCFLKFRLRNLVLENKQKHHKGVLAMLAQMAPPAIYPPPPPLSLANNPPRKSSLEMASVSPKHRRDWRVGSR